MAPVGVEVEVVGVRSGSGSETVGVRSRSNESSVRRRGGANPLASAPL
jgi:hypothetical protein